MLGDNFFEGINLFLQRRPCKKEEWMEVDQKRGQQRKQEKNITEISFISTLKVSLYVLTISSHTDKFVDDISSSISG